MIIPYTEYHIKSMEVGDVDPGNLMMRYVCDRFELNTEQRYWLAFLFATCYCVPTVYYIYNEFPDYENVDLGRLERWWAANRHRLIFQTDRGWVRSRNQFTKIFESYREMLGPRTQEQFYNGLRVGTKAENYAAAWAAFSNVYQFGRFAMFLYLEAVNVVTDFPMEPTSLDMREADSCRNGLAFAVGREDLMNHRSQKRIKKADMNYLQNKFHQMLKMFEKEHPESNIWNIETTLCAYKKYRLGKRYIGYYLDRQYHEIAKMMELVPEGVCWQVLLDCRKENYEHSYLREVDNGAYLRRRRTSHG